MVKFGPGSRLSVREGQFNPQVARDLFFYYSTVLLALFCFRILIKVSLCLFQYYYVVRENRRLAKKIYKDIHKDVGGRHLCNAATTPARACMCPCPTGMSRHEYDFERDVAVNLIVLAALLCFRLLIKVSLCLFQYVYVVCENRKEAKRINALLHGNVVMFAADHCLSQKRNTILDIGTWADRYPLHDAACCGQVLLLQKLVQEGANVNARTLNSFTPLHDACLGGHPGCVKILIGAGAQLNPRTIDGDTPLTFACSRGSVSCVKLLLHHGISPDPGLFTKSPLHEACFNGRHEVVEVLIEAGADVETVDSQYGSPLHVVCSRNYPECAELLLRAGANVDATKNYETALHVAAKTGSPEVVQVLLEYGANINAKDISKQRPVDLTDLGSEVRKILTYRDAHPSHLMQLCRLRIRHLLGRERVKYVQLLRLPPLLQDYVLYKFLK